MKVAVRNRIDWIQTSKPSDGSRTSRIEVQDARVVSREERGRREARRRQPRRASRMGTSVAMIALLISGLAGALVGSGTLSASGRFNAERLAAQRGEAVLFGPADVPGHSGSGATLQRSDMIRKFIALDGVN